LKELGLRTGMLNERRVNSYGKIKVNKKSSKNRLEKTLNNLMKNQKIKNEDLRPKLFSDLNKFIHTKKHLASTSKNAPKGFYVPEKYFLHL
jgi:5-bromo-4-chloroindolyl phosphate hydrolysis protein